ncbi:type II secretion system F family protein [Methylocystis heyeri]|uniref:Type II secretion system F family protein n=1 Tax=Methylocystis heyeri TaxID=391905 RepID=A0A6B8KER9_9HYPH|nr:type II secretion system F family protein [Methylocystis heyeri]QGM46177.1 type II secretion system F family protein [Methylocystis heyeri]
MVKEIVEMGSDPQLVSSLLVAIFVCATLYSVMTPFFATDVLAKRMKAVASEREALRARERALAKSSGGLRQQPKVYMKNVVEKFSLSRWLATDDARMKLASAGYRGPQAETTLLFFRAVTPIGCFLTTVFYLNFINDFGLSGVSMAGAAVAALYVGIKLPEIILSNTIQKRQASMKRAFPDALDLMLICVESGMSIEHAFRKVGQEIGVQSVPLAEEFAVATAELSYLPDRRVAYQNLAARTGLEGVKQICMVLAQAEKYGTPLGQALRTTAQEARDARMMEAEKIAAALPPKLTVPMILFFLPVLIVVVMAPAIMQVMDAGL